MHFAIPDTNESCSGEEGGGGGGGAESYTVYNVHVNGAYHCSLRYSQLLRLHEFLVADFGADFPLPVFPSKKLFGLTSLEKDQRRLLLEKYFQEVSQFPHISGSSLFRAFLLLAQRETHSIIEAASKSSSTPSPAPPPFSCLARNSSISSISSKTSGNASTSSLASLESTESTSDSVLPSRPLTIWLHNGHSIKLESVADASTAEVLETVADQIAIPNDAKQFFGLFLIITPAGSSEDSLDDFCILRELQDFEAPLLSLKVAFAFSPSSSSPSSSSSSSLDSPNRHKVLLARRYFDPLVDDFLMENKVTLNLLYVQVTSDLDRGCIFANKEQQHHLESLRRKNTKREFLRYARGLKFYGYRHFRPAIMDYPQRDTSTLICAGDQKLVFRVKANDGSIKEGLLKVQRMRCWRIVTQIVEEQQRQQQQREKNGNNHEEETNEIKEQQRKSSNDHPQNEESQSSTNNDENNDNNNDDNNNDNDIPPTLRLKCELSIEYLVARDTLQWITIVTDDAIFASMCLQTMVDELIIKRETGSLKSRRPPPSIKKEHLAGSQYVKRNGKLMTSTTTTKKGKKPGESKTEEANGRGKDGGEAEATASEAAAPVAAATVEERKRTPLEKRKSKGKVAAAAAAAEKKEENEAFGGIGEEDL